MRTQAPANSGYSLAAAKPGPLGACVLDRSALSLQPLSQHSSATRFSPKLLSFAILDSNFLSSLAGAGGGLRPIFPTFHTLPITF